VRRLKKTVEGAEALPSVIRSFVEYGDSEIRVHKEQSFRGLSSSESPSDALELFFPMPYNDEQVSIIRKLEHGDGVVVQGPPGTGKTHTIANIICHYLAQGKRVLVTAKSETALTEVVGKLPERIRPLSVALLTDERQGMKQFEHSIQTIASSVASIQPTRSAAEIAALQERLNQLHAKLSHLDHAVASFADQHMRSYTFQGKEVSPEEMAKLVLSQADQHDWLDDDLPEKDTTLPFDEADISAARQARLKVGESLNYLQHSIPTTDDFPSWSDLLELHRNLVRARTIESDLHEGTVFNLTDSSFETFEKAKALIGFLERRNALKTKLANNRQPSLETVAKHLRDMTPEDPLLASLIQACNEVRELEEKRKELLKSAVDVPAEAEENEDFVEAINRLSDGRSGFALPLAKARPASLLAR
jgi:Rad3-related DNA helicase